LFILRVPRDISFEITHSPLVEVIEHLEVDDPLNFSAKTDSIANLNESPVGRALMFRV
jgi:hypothetical protein